jgi:hypothetical protein
MSNLTGAYIHIARPRPNLLVNGGFEAVHPDGNLVGWSFKNASSDRRICDPPVGRRRSISGTCAFRFKGNKGEASLLTQTVRAKAGVPLAVAGDQILLGAEVAQRGWLKLTMKVTYANGKTKVSGNVYGDLPSYYTPAYPLLAFDVKRNVTKIRVFLRGMPYSGKFYLDSMTLMAVTPTVASRQLAALSVPLLPVPPAP